MHLDPSVCYRAVKARDVRYDGRFFTCVKTTGIYCRPICPARPPKLENCTFVPTAAAAQEAGFRPCLRCRPESSPDLDAWRGTSATVSRALKMIEGGALDEEDVASLAERLAIGERQLRRLFQRHIGAAPVTVAQTRRVLLAKQLLHQTDLSMIEVALASGFGSVRRFNETFQMLYQRPPSELRRRATAASPAPEISLLLPYRPPNDWESMRRFLEARAITGLEVVTSKSYSRVIELRGLTGSITVEHAPKDSALRVAVRFPHLAALSVIIARIRRMFDLSADPTAISAALSADPVLAPLVAARPGLRVPGAWNGFEVAVRAVLGQQVTLQAGVRLASKVVAEFGAPVTQTMTIPGLTHSLPKPERFETDKIARLGMPRARAAALAGIAAAFAKDPHLFDPQRDLTEAVSRLCELPGIGEWTAQYIAMRALGETDAFLAGDVALQRIIAAEGKRPNAAELLAHAERWRPWRAYAVLHLWTSDAAASPISTTNTRKETNHALAA
ncbi:transcriptional regulator, AraC family [Chthoniobacter flavus Ellin428]|uniref:DNA-3-methyladenine glycosylase II n=1 Tax=Chthoniobacter flavus Ellin428 TaxID=497964 RepID=B4DBN3_9BACT|nr:DNA-3-methyladenine glycosylase 2 family protein [Chthoniobacter flavus]EDY16135.1 transcriptional regulator, AraC family [Chthoniobacter flavus Ellin428]TCO86736.1 DNA-3-methyladenine glycosylase II [Chthoniobacter flavus]